MQEQPTRRARKKRATYLSLRSAARQLVAERGLDQVTVKDIAEEADVSLRTFYRHFSSKEDAVAGGSADVRRLFLSFVASQPGNELPTEVVAKALRYRTTLLTPDQRASYSVIADYPSLERHYLSAVRDIERDLLTGLAAREGNSASETLYLRLLCAVSATAYRLVTEEWRRTDRRLADILTEVLGYLEPGFEAKPLRDSATATKRRGSSKSLRRHT